MVVKSTPPGRQRVGDAPVAAPGPPPRLTDLRLDIQRSILLLRTALKYGMAPVFWWLARQPLTANEIGMRLRLALEELGITYLKVGQFLAMRYDILPTEVCHELNKLFENVSPLTLDQVVAVIESELGGPLARHFSSLKTEPLGAASIAQVHAARTAEGDRVAVKVQRPGIERIFKADIRILRRGARLIDMAGLLGTLSAVEMLDEFARWTLRELDFRTEGRTADRLREEALPHEIVPMIHWDLTTSKVLTMELVEGMSLAQVAEHLDARDGSARLHDVLPNFDRDLVLHRLAQSSLNQLFTYGFFHGDPHPGNILVRDDNRIAFIDFGIFGELSEHQRRVVAGMVQSIALGNIGQAQRFFARQFAPTSETDYRAFQRDARAGLRAWYEASINAGAPMKDRHLGKYVGLMLSIARNNRLRMGAGYLLVWRVLNALDSTVLRLSEEFDIVAEMRTYFERSPNAAVRSPLEEPLSVEQAATVVELGQDAPNEVMGLLHSLRTGPGERRVLSEESAGQRRDRDRHAVWIALALVTVSLFVLSAGAPLSETTRLVLVAVAATLSGAVVWVALSAS
jgi:ubiquinone biosynthesis protein